MKKTVETTYHRSCHKSNLILHDTLSLLPLLRVRHGPLLVEPKPFLSWAAYRMALGRWGSVPSRSVPFLISARAVFHLQLELNTWRRHPYSLCHVQPCGFADRIDSPRRLVPLLQLHTMCDVSCNYRHLSSPQFGGYQVAEISALCSCTRRHTSRWTPWTFRTTWIHASPIISTVRSRFSLKVCYPHLWLLPPCAPW